MKMLLNCNMEKFGDRKMSLFVCKENDAGLSDIMFGKEKRVLYFSSYQDIQNEFCTSLEMNVYHQDEEVLFLIFHL